MEMVVCVTAGLHGGKINQVRPPMDTRERVLRRRWWWYSGERGDPLDCWRTLKLGMRVTSVGEPSMRWYDIVVDDADDADYCDGLGRLRREIDGGGARLALPC